MNKKEVLELLKRLTRRSSYEKVWVNADGDDRYDSPIIDSDRFIEAIDEEIMDL